MYSNKLYFIYQKRKAKKEKFADLEEKLRTSDSILQKINEKSRERKHLKKEILRVLKKNSIRKSTRHTVKEVNIGFFPRNKVEILAGVISLGLVEEQKVIRRNCIRVWS